MSWKEAALTAEVTAVVAWGDESRSLFTDRVGGGQMEWDGSRVAGLVLAAGGLGEKGCARAGDERA